MTHAAYNEYVSEFHGPMAVVRGCRLCKFFVIRKIAAHGRRSWAGRGTGFIEGNQQRGALIQHLKTEHPAEYAAAMAKERAP